MNKLWPEARIEAQAAQWDTGRGLLLRVPPDRPCGPHDHLLLPHRDWLAWVCDDLEVDSVIVMMTPPGEHPEDGRPEWADIPPLAAWIGYYAYDPESEGLRWHNYPPSAQDLGSH